jgi:WD40 repeat protein
MQSSRKGAPPVTQPPERHPNDSKWPVEERANPYHSIQVPEPGNVRGWVLHKTYEGHQLGIASIALHPRKPILATASDDITWKVWKL